MYKNIDKIVNKLSIVTNSCLPEIKPGINIFLTKSLVAVKVKFKFRNWKIEILKLSDRRVNYLNEINHAGNKFQSMFKNAQ